MASNGCKRPPGPRWSAGPLRPLAAHLFTTREWALGSGAGSDDEWAPVAAVARGVDLDHLVRLRQVHGAAVVVHRAGDGFPPSASRGGHRAFERSARRDRHPDRRLRAAPARGSPDRRGRRRPRRLARTSRGCAGSRGQRARARVRCAPGGSRRRHRAVDCRALRTRSAPMSRTHSLPRALAAIGWCAGSAMAAAGDGTGSSTDRAVGGRSARRGGCAGRADPRRRSVHGGHPALFCSYRRDAAGAGRMAAAIRCRPTR